MTYESDAAMCALEASRVVGRIRLLGALLDQLATIDATLDWLDGDDETGGEVKEQMP